jgi:hypothetical protein
MNGLQVTGVLLLIISTVMFYEAGQWALLFVRLLWREVKWAIVSGRNSARREAKECGHLTKEQRKAIADAQHRSAMASRRERIQELQDVWDGKRGEEEE